MTLEQKMNFATRKELQFLGNEIARAIILKATDGELQMAILRAMDQGILSREDVSSFLNKP